MTEAYLLTNYVPCENPIKKWWWHCSFVEISSRKYALPAFKKLAGDLYCTFSFPQLLYGWDILSIKLPETALEKHNCPGITNAMTAWIYISGGGGGGEKKQKCIVGPLSLEFQSTRAERHTVRKFRNRAHCQKIPHYDTLSEKSAIWPTVRKVRNRAHCQKSPQ